MSVPSSSKHDAGSLLRSPIFASVRIAVNTRLLLPNKLEGIGWFSHESLQRVVRNHPEHEFVFLFDRDFSAEFVYADNVTPVVIGPQSRHPVLWYWWFERSVPKALRQHKADLFLSPDGYLSLRTDVPSVPVIHDINFEHYPQDLPPAFRQYYRHFFPKFARFATRVATVSEYSKEDIAEQYSVAPDKIDVVYNGCNPRYQPVGVSVQQQTRDELTQGQPYFLFIGSLHPRKNIVNLFKAFDAFRTANDSATKLVVVGEKKWWTADMRAAHEGMQYGDEVIFTGRLAPDKLAHVLASAQAMVYVSYFEGFGIPIVEAFYADVPVLTSNVTSMPEVAGDAAVLVDPFSVESIANGMQQLDSDADLRQRLVAAGRQQRENFSWDKTAARLWDCLMRAVPEAV